MDSYGGYGGAGGGGGGGWGGYGGGGNPNAGGFSYGGMPSSTTGGASTSSNYNQRNTGGGGGGGGGFEMGGGGGSFSQGAAGGGGGGGDKKRNNQVLRPIMLKQIVDAVQAAPESGWTVDGSEISQISVVGRIISIQRTSTNTKFQIEDGSASMEVTKWLDRSADGGGNGGGDFDDDNNNSSSSGDNFGEGMYVKVIGHLRDFKGKKAIGAYHMSQIEHPDLITMHALDAALVHLELTRGILNNNNNKNPHTNVVGAGGAGAAVGGGGAPRMQFHDDNPNFSKLENAVSGFVRRMATGSEGVVINDVVFGLRSLASEQEIRAVIANLADNGYFYETIDENHIALAEILA